MYGTDNIDVGDTGSKTTNGRRQRRQHGRQQTVDVSAPVDDKGLNQPLATSDSEHPRRPSFKFVNSQVTIEKG